MLRTTRECETHMKNNSHAEYTQAKSTQTHKVHLVPADAYYRGSWDSTNKVPIIFSYGSWLIMVAEVIILSPYRIQMENLRVYRSQPE